jgi:simple sugar transport system ATP-binding protein
MLHIQNLTKQFGGFAALQDVNFSVQVGEIVGLLGENGAGKSTLLKIIGGETAPTSGRIFLDNKPLHLHSPQEAKQLGIGVVHQHFMLVPVFTVAENIALHAGSKGVFHADFWARQIETWSASLGWRINPQARIEDLSVGEQQRVEILKALFAGGQNARSQTAKLLLLDEPTANLTPGEVDELMSVLHHLGQQNCAIVFVSHKLHEVMELCDRVVVLRGGKVTGEREVTQTSTNELAGLMVGRDLNENEPRSLPSTPTGTRQFKIKSLSRGQLQNFHLTVQGGEIVGLAGVDGNGQRELLETLSSLQKPESGTFSVEDNGKASQGTLGLIPADRQTTGLILDFNLTENLALHPIPRRKFKRKFQLAWQGLGAFTRDLMARFDVRTPATQEKTFARRLSGGNQQKLVVARALSFGPSAVIAADPTRGLDVGAAQFVHENLRRVADEGTPVLLVSSDLDEVLHLSDRIGVLYEGRLLPDENLLPAGTPREQIGALMGGARQLTIDD